MARDLETLWLARLGALCTQVRETARAALADALSRGDGERLARPVRQGAGDVTFALDQCTEDVITNWLEHTARTQPISLLTEDEGWRHRGPGPGGAALELADFDHGGPRIAIDPIDGTRHLMSDLRSAWSIVSFAPPGSGEPRMSDLTLGLVSEIPDSRAARWRSLSAVLGHGAHFEERTLTTEVLHSARRLNTGKDARADHGYFPMFRYLAAQRPLIAAVEARFFERLARLEHADTRSCYDDQYISSGGQLALLCLGTYRMSVDLRATLGTARPEIPSLATHPYDIAGAVLVAREAGADVTGIDGERLDFPIDCTTPVSFAAWVNPGTRARLEPHLRAALAEVLA